MIYFTEFKKIYQKVEVEHYPNSVPKNVVVSVLVQTYNHEKYLEQCLESILSQKTDFPFEIILGEDNSSDNTRQICKKYAKKFPDKIRLIFHRDENKIKVNGITTGNFNAFYNLFSARGKYIAFCEGDDYWTDSLKLTKQISCLENNSQAILAYHEIQEENENNKLIRKALIQPRFDVSDEELKKLIYHPHFSTVCFRNEIKEFPSQIFEVINLDSFLLSLLGRKGLGKFIPEITSNIYRIHDQGIWTNKKRYFQLKIKIDTFQKIAKFYTKINDLRTSNNFEKLAMKYRKMVILYVLKRGKVPIFLKEIFSISMKYWRLKMVI